MALASLIRLFWLVVTGVREYFSGDIPADKTEIEHVCSTWLSVINTCQTQKEVDNVEGLIEQYFYNRYKPKDIRIQKSMIVEALLKKEAEISERNTSSVSI